MKHWLHIRSAVILGCLTVTLHNLAHRSGSQFAYLGNALKSGKPGTQRGDEDNRYLDKIPAPCVCEDQDSCTGSTAAHGHLHRRRHSGRKCIRCDKGTNTSTTAREHAGTDVGVSAGAF
eukprot:gnl/MRDRNA2_/MRDRNA2_63429_c0_seq1.p1 gnl/MRDRNA2_/MRDRNA2_63429_c0~~gnl/MRDRNA2_/MRDRNA2_63429_c0_seq1.p1  ORF type:complete len:119 (+),score=4.24 gnl/MRDRNA2_/MRDRNA2_63429_c0_seq1:60-416(+)